MAQLTTPIIDDLDRVILACVRAELPVKVITAGTGVSRATVHRRIKAVRARVSANRKRPGDERRAG